MTTEEILARELGKLEGLFVGLSPTSFVAGFLPTERATASFSTAMSPESAVRRSADLLGAIGTLQEPVEPTDHPALWAVVGSGFGGLNPCLLAVEFAASESGGTEIVVSGAAKEGLIKQKTAKRAVDRFVASFGDPSL